MPTLSLIIKLPTGEPFSELFIIGPNHTMDDIPFNIKEGMQYSIYLGVGNHMGIASYYTCIVKLQNGVEALTYPTSEAANSAYILYEYKMFIQDGQTWEAPLAFEVNRVSFSDSTSQLSIITVNNEEFVVNKASSWDTNRTGYYYSLLVELWIFNSTLGTSQFHNRSIYLTLNMTQ